MCTQTIRDGDLLCVRTDDHETHVFHASWCDDMPRDEETNT
jgi:hypothetical protein